jgi:hypothetical protein
VTALLTPAYKLTVADRMVDTTDEPRASTVVELSVELSMDTPADRVVLELGQLQQHQGEKGLVGAGLQVQTRLADADDGAEKVLDAGGQPHHLVGLELGQIDDDVGVEEVAGDLQLVESAAPGTDLDRFGKGGEGGAGLLDHRQDAAAHRHLTGGADSGRVADRDDAAGLLRQADDGADDLRVGGHRLLRRFAGEHVRLEQHLLPRADEGRHPAQGSEQALDGGFDLRPMVVGGGLQDNPLLHPASSRMCSRRRRGPSNSQK